jgi:hypothetical protein
VQGHSIGTPATGSASIVPNPKINGHSGLLDDLAATPRAAKAELDTRKTIAPMAKSRGCACPHRAYIGTTGLGPGRA